MSPNLARTPGRYRWLLGALVLTAAAAAAQPAPGAGPSGAVDAGCASAEFAREVLQRINALRQRGAVCGRRGAFGALAPVQWHPQLAAGASAYAHEMAAYGHFGHAGPAGGALDQRLRASGYPFRVAAENIASGQQSIDEVLGSWMNSEGHCTNIMNGALRDVGMACADGQPQDAGPYWTLMLGTPK
jgi:uncharacterized protein YkwD